MKRYSLSGILRKRLPKPLCVDSFKRNTNKHLLNEKTAYNFFQSVGIFAEYEILELCEFSIRDLE